MKWKLPPKIKIYEALGAIGDDRIHVTGNTARVYSSSGNKFYTVTYDPEKQAIMANDNGSYWQGDLGYPAIAYLIKTGRITHDPQYAEALKSIQWKDINTKFKNDFEKTAAYINEVLAKKGIDRTEFQREIMAISQQIEILDLSFLGKKKRPPSGY